MTKELLQQALDALIESRDDVDLCYAGVKAARLSFRQERQLGFYEAQLVKHDAAIEALKQALAQQEQPASVDAYVGAREDAAIWKKRALEAEELNRKFIADVNGPTYLGEPVKQELPAQKVSESWTDIVAVNLVREGVNKHKARELAAHFLTLFAPPTPPAQEPVAWLHGTTFQVVVSKNRPNSLAAWLPLFAHPAPTQPALSDEQILDIFSKVSADGMGHYMTAVGRAIEAHCRGSTQTQPALSDDDLDRLWRKAEATISARSNVQIYGRLIEAHCRGGATS